MSAKPSVTLQGGKKTKSRGTARKKDGTQDSGTIPVTRMGSVHGTCVSKAQQVPSQAEEQGTGVTLSHCHPLKGRWLCRIPLAICGVTWDRVLT